jgi:hypothetical protein
MALRPGAATLLSLVVPGSAHVALGHPVRGALAFVTAVGLFAFGVAMLGDRLWHLSPVPLSGMLAWFPVLLQPEFVNLGCTTIVAMTRDFDPESARHVLLPRDGEHFWMLLTAASAFLAAFWAADANWIASRSPRTAVAPARAAVLSWLVPGLGHAIAGQRSKGILLGAVVTFTFALGLVLGGGHSCDRPQFPFWWAGQSIFGGGVMFASVVTAPGKMLEYPPLFDLGLILCTIAGLMNAIVITDAWTVAERGVLAEVDSATIPAAGEVPA